MVSLCVSIARFTSVPDEHYDTIESAFAAKALAQWTAIVPHSQLTLKIEKNPDKLVMKCMDGDDIRVQFLHLQTHRLRSNSGYSRAHGTYLLSNETLQMIHQDMSSSSNSPTLSFDGIIDEKRFLKRMDMFNI
jgi:hypothetical protein